MKAIKSVLANRKMFRGGGLVPSRNEMVDLNAPSGILSSSMPLIDAVESDALSAEGGTALMSRGGYAHGGLHAPNPIRNNNPPIVVPNVDAWDLAKATPIAPMPSLEVQSLTPDLNTAVPTFGSSDMPISFDFKLEDVRTILGQQQDVGQVDALVERIFPSDLQPGRLAKEFTDARIARSESPEAIAAGPSADIRLGEGNLGEPESGRMSRVTENVLRNTAGIREGVSKIFGTAIDHAASWADYQFSGDTRDFTREQVYWINEMVQRRPDLQADIEAFATQSARGGTRDLDQFKHDIAAGISKKYEDTGQYTRFEGADDVRYRAENVEAGANPEVIAETLRREAANAASYDASLSERDPQGMFGPRGETPLAELLSGPEALEFQNYMSNRGLEITEDSIYEMYKKGRDAGISVERIENSLSPEYLRRFENQYMIDTGGEEETVTETEAGTETGEEVINIGDVKVTPEDEVDQSDLVTALQTHGELVAKREMDLGEDGTLENEARNQQHDTLVAGVREAANAGNEKETKRTLETYIQEFKDAMPDYEGKSEWEQGLDIVKMGMAIAAGQDPNAITNIANGVLATIDNFTEDEEAKRAYKQQVNLSAAQYGLTAVERDREAAIALATERRERVEYVANKSGVDPRTGSPFAKGDVIAFSAGEIHDGILGTFDAGTVILPETFADFADAEASQATLNSKIFEQNRIKYAQYQEDRKEYSKHTTDLLSGMQMKLLLGDAVQIAAEGNILGATSFIRNAVDSTLNVFGVQQEDRGGYLAELELSDKKQYQEIINQISTRMITQILNEGNRTISDADRRRVEDLVGTYSDMMKGLPGSEEALKIQLEGLERSIDEGIGAASADLRSIEASYRNKYNEDRLETLEEIKRYRFSRAGIDTGGTVPATPGGMTLRLNKETGNYDIVPVG
jgi:hypothetical protein